ncbi:hypothetical protein F4677DRAFT_465751 [Hypoxylon crocopeplum]|nr:hypothetical protein F4677DRAFT_465751 [Hypoxylon crocopeplum]
MSQQRPIDNVDREVLGKMTHEEVPQNMSQHTVEDSESDRKIVEKQQAQFIEWMAGFEFLSVYCYSGDEKVAESAQSAESPESLQSLEQGNTSLESSCDSSDLSASPPSPGTRTPSTPNDQNNEPAEGVKARNESNGASGLGPGTTQGSSTSNDETAKSLAYGEIPFEQLAEPEKFSNDFFEVKKSSLGGNGVFAKKDLKCDEVILEERPLINAIPSTLNWELEKLAPDLQAAYFRMHRCDRYQGQEPRESILFTNSFLVPGGSCVYLIGARFNHACAPIHSVDYRRKRGNVMEFRMRRDVPAGEELTITYGRMPPKNLYLMWGFRCACGGCKSLTDAEVARIKAATEIQW